PEAVLADGVPGAHRVLRVMLEQHFDPVPAAQAQRFAERPRHDDVAALVGLAEDAGIAGEASLGIDGDGVHSTPPLRLLRMRPPAARPCGIWRSKFSREAPGKLPEDLDGLGLGGHFQSLRLKRRLAERALSDRSDRGEEKSRLSAAI